MTRYMEVTGKYKPRYNTTRWMNPPKQRRTNRQYESPKEGGYWANVIFGTIAVTIGLFFIWFISG